jgi:3,2-trans-enoyl-CoA isomerase
MAEHDALVTIERDGKVAALRMCRPPVNAIESGLCRALVGALDALEADAGVEAVVLAGRPGLFSAGLDLPALLALDRADMRAFWVDFVGAFLRLYRTPLVLVAAIEGHAPAGGTVFAITADHRVMADGPYKMGLNEVAVGLAVPPFLCAVVVGLLGQRNAERLLTTGALLPPHEALAVGFVDEVVGQDEVIARAKAEALRRTTLPPEARRETKRLLRARHSDAIAAGIEHEVDAFLDFWFRESCQAALAGVVASLSRRGRS